MNRNNLIVLFQHPFEFVDRIHVCNYLMFDLYVATIMMNEEDVQLTEIHAKLLWKRRRFTFHKY